jgi:hypothetical protein
MHRGWYLLLLLGLIVGGCSAPGTASSRNSDQALPAPKPYVRISGADSNHVELQIAARQFLPAHRGQPVVWLTGVSHLGDARYYSALQSHLDAQTLVLYEGVGAAEAENANDSSAGSDTSSSPAVEPAEASDSRGSLQSAMAASLGLVFQLEAIDYRRQNFRNSDLSITQLRQLMSQAETGSGQPGASESFENLLQMMEGNSWFDSLLQFALRFLGANPKFQALGRVALIDLLGQIQGDPSRLQGLPLDMKQLLEVLLQRRNEKVIADLKARLPEIGRHGSIAIFFGTGHMPDMEKRLRAELKYQPAEELWFTAFGVDLAKARITATEREFIDNFVKWQLSEAKASIGDSDSGKAEPKSSTSLQRGR